MFGLKSLFNRGKGEVYFTIHTGGQGFTDQMMQFSAFYKLGLSLNYHYIFSPFVSSRSMPVGVNNPETKPADVYDFLGFNQYFNTRQHQLADNQYESLEVELSDNIVEQNRIFSIAHLKMYVARYVAENREGRGQLLVIFRLERRKPKPGKGKRQFFSLIHSAIPCFQDGTSLRNIYDECRQSNPLPALFEGNKLKILVHIRQGDTASIETPWHSFIPVDVRRADYLTEQTDYAAMNDSFSNNFVDSLFQPEEYFDFLIHLSKSLEETPSVLTFSDGYQRAFRIIEDDIGRLGLSPEKRKSLLMAQASYDDSKFKDFYELEYSRNFIGETDESLHQLIDSALRADVLIVAAQQRMLPKLAANYCSKESPLIIVLYRNSAPDYSDLIENDGDRYIYTDIDRPDYAAIAEKILQLKL